MDQAHQPRTFPDAVGTSWPEFVRRLLPLQTNDLGLPDGRLRLGRPGAFATVELRGRSADQRQVLFSSTRK